VSCEIRTVKLFVLSPAANVSEPPLDVKSQRDKAVPFTVAHGVVENAALSSPVA
jgi:hypothetical protein